MHNTWKRYVKSRTHTLTQPCRKGLVTKRMKNSRVAYLFTLLGFSKAIRCNRQIYHFHVSEKYPSNVFKKMFVGCPQFCMRLFLLGGQGCIVHACLSGLFSPAQTSVVMRAVRPIRPSDPSVRPWAWVLGPWGPQDP
jgi:hypothetical protein